MTEGFQGFEPVVGRDVFIAPTACVIGDVEIGDGSSIWHGAVLRGDCWSIRIGALTNIQDGCICHVTTGGPQLVIGDRVTVGHAAVLHSCTVEDSCLIGMGAIILDGVTIGGGSIVAVGTVLLEGTDIPSNSLVAGVPGRIKKKLDEGSLDLISKSAEEYHVLAMSYLGKGEFNRDSTDHE